MRHRLIAVAAVATALSATMAAQSAAPKAATKAAAKFMPPKTPWGDPDLQGNWPATAGIPLQRDPQLGDKASLTPEEFAARVQLSKERAEKQGRTRATRSDSDEVNIGGPSNWSEGGKPHPQTSMVVDPPNGRIPPMTPEAIKRVKDQRNGAGPAEHFPEKVDTWEDFDLYSRCITRGVIHNMLPTSYNYGNDIYQAPGYVVIRSEMIHDVRIIPLDGRPHVGENIRMYMGDARGHWEGSTLVVETSNVTEMPGFAGVIPVTKAFKAVERFTRTSASDLSYEVTISDPGSWTKPFTIRYPYKNDPEYKVLEYGCHEGNYMMLDALTGARKLESEGKSTEVLRGPKGGPLPGSRF